MKGRSEERKVEKRWKQEKREKQERANKRREGKM